MAGDLNDKPEAATNQLLHARQVREMGTAEIPSITDQPSERRDEPGSDHRPVVARLELA